ncbi:tyrosine--tRNA ligase [Mycoplasma bradburyae]|uniref:tyrosine--tRNA ligase n=1 Tax=Mycoplasma bradburyae TaxID=2963128 RepID=UPI0023427D8B|nr:tyrosine--tRNA ligase [Mycoplasma bradburyae]MDC4184128.1 tyrosine--tRNA ligase [Mycoplasma bradburyae]
MDFIAELKKRNIIKQISNEEKLKLALEHEKGVYVGFDPSGQSLHLGNLIPIITLKYFKKIGFKTYAILGGATGLIGDPSGKASERKIQDSQVIADNAKKIQAQLERYTNATIINNIEFYKNMNFLSFLRDVGKLINVSYLLDKEFIRSRIENGISYAEFSYNLIQGNDFLHLFEKYDVQVQCGGSDQWGNITTGIDLIKKKYDEEQTKYLCGLTFNLLLNSNGNKFGKSEKGALYLDENLTHPYEIWQYIYNQDDEFIVDLIYRYALEESLEKIEEIIKAHKEDKKARIGQRYLADYLIKLIHSQEHLDNVYKMNRALFENKIKELSDQEKLVVFANFDKVELDLNQSYKIIDLLLQAKVADSKRILKELISQGSIQIDDIKVDNPETVYTSSKDKKLTVIKKGKKNYFVVIWK